MIYLTDGNMPLNNAYWDKISQEDGITYQLTFRFPTSDPLWERLKEETFLIADDLHGEQDFVIFEVEKKQGYIQIYANQVFTLLNNFVTGPISLDRVTGTTALSRFAGAITRDNPFSFFSDISERHTFNTETKNAMQVFAKDKHSILGQWGGDLVRHGYQVRLLKNGGSENESLFMYKKNLSSYQHKTSTKSLKTRITFKATVKGEGENAPDRKFSVVVDSPLINKYSQIYEDVIEVNDQDVKDEASLRKYGEQYFKTSLCDMMEDSLELEVVGQSDVPVQIYDIVSLFYEVYNLDVRKKITKYTYSPMAKKLLSIGFGQFKSGLANAIGNAVSDAVRGEAQQLHDDFEKQLERELKNADRAFEHQKEELVNQFTDGLNAAKAKVEEVKAAMTDQLNLKINQSKSEVTERLKSDFDRKLATAQNDLAGVRANLTQAQSRLSGDISQIQSDIADIRGKQSQSDSELVKQAQSINQAKSELAGVKTNLTQAQNQLSGNINQIRADVGNIRTKQTQTETEIGKQVSALNQTKVELAGVKSAQATYEQTTTRRLAELSNVADGKASKSQLVQTTEELSSKIASVHLGRRNLLKGTKELARYKPASEYNGFKVIRTVAGATSYRDSYTERTVVPTTGTEYIAIFYARASENDYPMRCHFYNPNTVTSSENSNGYKSRSSDGLSIIRLSTDWQLCWVKWTQTATDQAKTVIIGRHGPQVGGKEGVWVEICAPALFEGNLVGDWTPAYEDQEERVTAVESTLKQRADSLEAGVTRLTEGLKTKADSSALTLLSDRILASVKSLETGMDNKLDSKLSTAVFEVRASGIRQEILNATKDKADKTLVVTEAGKLREELASQVGSGRNLWINSKIVGNPVVEALPAGHITGQRLCYKLTNNQELSFNIEPDFSTRLFRKITFSAWVKYENVVKGANNWNVFNCFKHYMFLRNSQTGTTSGVSYLTLAGYDGTSDWKRIVFTYDYSSNKGYDQLKTILRFNLENVRSGTAWITGIQVEFGSVATEYAPALEDVEGLITEAKATFERTAQGLRMDLSAVQAYVNADGTRSEALRTYSREETARQLTAERKAIEAGYVGKATYSEDVRSISRRFEELTEGGVNLLRNSATLPVSGDYRTGKWVATSGGNGTTQVAPVTSSPSPLIKSMIRIVNNTVGNKDLSQSAMALVVGQKYTVSCYARVASDSPSPTVGLLIRSWANNNDTNRKLHKTISNREWQRYSFTFTADVVANSIQFGQSGAGSVEICAPKIELGTVATSWSPSPEDATSYADTKLAEFRQGIDGQLASVQAALNTANGSLTSFNTWKQSAQETLNKVGRVEIGLNEAKTSLAEFKQTAQGLRTDLTAIQSYVNADGTRSEALRTYSREETARQLTAERKAIEVGYVGKATYAEDVKGISRRFEELKSSSDTKFAEFKQGIDGQFATISSQIGESLKKTDISITPGQITLGTGKVVNGQTLASLFVQNPESMQAITKLMRITGDLIVDGSITGRDLAAGAITTPHLAAGAVTAEVLGANAVTADKVKADDALLEKLTAGEALLRKLMAKDAFINRLQSIDFAAEQIKGGLLRSIDGSLIFDLNKNTLTMSSNTAAIKRVLPGHPTQFMRYETERKGNVDYTRTIIGSNRNGSEKFDSVTFAGLVVENSNKAGIEDSLRLYGDNTYFRHAQGEVGWNINAVTQRIAPATWQKESAVWARNFVVPKHRNPNGRDWVKLEETVAALWRLWEHAAGNQVTMTGAMRDKVRELFQNYGYNYGIS